MLCLFRCFSFTHRAVLALRVEWAKAKARADRWGEEVVIIDEEMRRVLAFGKWKADWWVDQAKLRTPEQVLVTQGLAAYAARQAAMELDVQEGLTQKWMAIRVRALPVIQRVWRGMGGLSVVAEDGLLDDDLDIGGSGIVELDLGALGMEDDEDQAAYGSDYEE